MRGRIGGVRGHWDRRRWWNEWDWRRRVHGRKMLWVRRLWPVLLRNHLRRRAFLSQQHLFVLWQCGRDLLPGHERNQPMRGGYGLQQHVVFEQRPMCPLR